MNSFFRCYYCGGENDRKNAVDNKLQCQYCRRWISLPDRLDQDKLALYELGKQKMTLLRFEEAEEVFKLLIEKDPLNGDAYWQALLCHYGVQYILDETTGQNVPTISLLSKEPILKHSYYLQAIRNTEDETVRATYQAEAEHISNILLTYEKVSASEKPYDVFISVKQGTDLGTPTNDSFEAARLMQFLEGKGLRVFNSRFSLKDIVGKEYEPYIMAALLSSRAMVVVGSSREYLESDWVRNEWRRFRWLQENDPEKRVLIPFLLGLSPKEVPDEMGTIQYVTNTSTSPYADILRAIRTTIPLAVQNLKRPTVLPDDIVLSDKGKWLDRVKTDLSVFEELNGAVIPDMSTAKDACSYMEILCNNLKKLDGYAEADSLLHEAENLKKYFYSEYERHRLEDSAARLRTISEQMSHRIADHQEACAIQDELLKLRQDINSCKGRSQVSSLLEETDKLLGEAKKLASRLDPNNIITDPLRRAVAVGKGFLAALRKDGTVLVDGPHKTLVSDAENWSDITSISAGDRHLVGLMKNGSVVACGNNKNGQCEVDRWSNIISISACANHTIGLASDGTCHGTGDNSSSQINVENWRDIVSVSTSRKLTVACDMSGKAFSTGSKRLRAANISGWDTVERVYAIGNKAAAICRDGEVLLVGNAPRRTYAQVNEINKKKQTYLSFNSFFSDSFAALTGTGKARLISWRNLCLHQIVFLVLGFFLIGFGSMICDNLTLGSSDMEMLPLVLPIILVLLLVTGWLIRSIYLLVQIPFTAFSVHRWKDVIEIASNGKLKSLTGLQKNGRLIAKNQANLPQWSGLGLPDLE